MAKTDYSHSSGTFTSSIDSFQIYYQVWMPENAKRVVIIQHGFGEHSGRYGHVLEAFNRTGTAFYALDARGHGKTPGIRGHVSSFQRYCDDLGDFISLAKDKTGLNTIYLLGHSLGGVITARTMQTVLKANDVSGIILSSSGFRPDLDIVKFVKKTVATFLASFVPSITVDAGLDVKLLSHDASEVKKYTEDPLVHGKISLRMGSEMFESGENAIANAGSIKIPLYVFHGEADGIAMPQGSKDFFARAGSPDKTLKIYPGLFHETMNEVVADREKVLSDLKQWVLLHG